MYILYIYSYLRIWRPAKYAFFYQELLKNKWNNAIKHLFSFLLLWTHFTRRTNYENMVTLLCCARQGSLLCFRLSRNFINKNYYHSQEIYYTLRHTNYTLNTQKLTNIFEQYTVQNNCKINSTQKMKIKFTD